MLPPRGYVFIFLNVVRFLSIIGLLLVFASNVVVLADDIKAVNRFIAQGSNNTTVFNSTDGSLMDCSYDYIDNSTVPNQPAGVFWAVVNRLLIIFQVIVLLLSEMGWPQAFFNSFFPVLGEDFGLGPLGIFECLIGAAVLSHHVETFAMVAAFFLFSLGCLNIFLGLIFRGDGRAKRSFTSWRERSKPVLPKVTNDVTGNSTDFSDKTRKLGFGRQLETNGYGFGSKGEKAAGLKGFLITKPLETLPRYAPKPTGSTENDSVNPSAPSASPSFSSSPTAI